MLALLLSLTISRLPAAMEQPTEYQVKAAFLFNFLKYVSWPADSPLLKSAIYRIGLIGTDPFGSTLDEIVSGASIEGRPVLIARLSDPDSLRSCHIVFVKSASDSLLSSILRQAEQFGIVTVGESPTFIEDGGVIRLRLKDDQVRFDINLAAANRSGLRISSKLLQLAQEIYR